MIKRIFFLILIVLCIGGIFLWHSNACRIDIESLIMARGISIVLICKGELNMADAIKIGDVVEFPDMPDDDTGRYIGMSDVDAATVLRIEGNVVLVQGRNGLNAAFYANDLNVISEDS